jgi:hypothetical protein
MSRPLLTILSMAGLIMAGVGIWVMFPQIGEIGEEAGVSGIPYIALIFAGLIVGSLMAVLRKHVGKTMNRYLLNLGIGFLIWGVIGAIAGLLNGEGAYLQRALEGRVIGLWFSSLYIILCLLPGSLGSYAALTGSRAAMASTVAMMMAMSLTAMIYSEARYNVLLDQEIPPSIMAIVGMVLFVEGLGMIRREDDYKGGRTILSRNLAFLIVFTAIASVIAIVPFIIDPGIFGIYELRTIYGKAVLGLILLVPLGILAIARRGS